VILRDNYFSFSREIIGTALVLVAERGPLVREITLDGGVKVRTFSPPPPGFHPLIASAAELAKFGFPARPDHPEHLERYRRVFDQIKDRFHYIEPAFKVNTKRRHGLASKRGVEVQAVSEVSIAWSGGVVYAPPGESFRWMVGEWMVPNVSGPPVGLEYFANIWIGLDGDPVSESPNCLAVGVGIEDGNVEGSIDRIYYPFFSWYTSPYLSESLISNVSVNPGDIVDVVICTSGEGASEATVYFANLTSGGATSFVLEAPAAPLIGNSAEWIVQRSEVNTTDGQWESLADYGEVFFSGCQAVSYSPDGSYSQIIGGGTGDNIDMVNSDGDILSQGILVAPTVVQCVFVSSD
jgi:hypothetical protein